MELQTHDLANVRVIQVAGRIDSTNFAQFQDALLPQLSACRGETQKVVLDLSGIPYMSSAGLRVLMNAFKQCQQQQGAIVCAALQPVVQEVFRISRFDLVFQVFPTVAESLAQLSPTAAVAYAQRA